MNNGKVWVILIKYDQTADMILSKSDRNNSNWTRTTQQNININFQSVICQDIELDKLQYKLMIEMSIYIGIFVLNIIIYSSIVIEVDCSFQKWYLTKLLVWMDKASSIDVKKILQNFWQGRTDLFELTLPEWVQLSQDTNHSLGLLRNWILNWGTYNYDNI